ncbi:unnamed protein product, partial [Pelagomonas calceolata]
KLETVTGRAPRPARSDDGEEGLVPRSRLGRQLRDDAHGVAEVLDLLGALVGQLDVELLLDLHDHLDNVERVRAEVRGEGRLGRDRRLLDAELLGDDLLELVLDGKPGRHARDGRRAHERRRGAEREGDED